MQRGLVMIKYNLQFFGGRGAGANIAKAITLDEFLARKGVSDSSSGWVIDKLRGNRQIVTRSGRERFEKERSKAEAEYQEKRNSAISEYNLLVKQGKIRDKTPIEKKIDIANGNPDLQSTQAARRLLEKRGIDWRKKKRRK